VRAVYLSCDPDTLARDLDDFAARGYRTESVEPFDFLPQTEHVEAVARLTRDQGLLPGTSAGSSCP
jgi:23S rRNA (uracil1939-C5)-methyltransferase